MLKKTKAYVVADVLLVMMFLLIGVGFCAPQSEVEAERSIVIAAPPERIAPLINDIQRWREWSVSSGEFRILSTTPELIRVEQDVTGVPASEFGEFRFVSVDEGTRVTWRYAGKTQTVLLIIGTEHTQRFSSDMKRSLQNLKTVVEAAN